MRGGASFLALSLGFFSTGQALADPRLDEKVYDPYVENGVAELELRPSQQIGGPTNGESTTVIEAEYGLNDRLSLALVGALHRDPGGSSRLDSVGVEGVVYLGQIPKTGIDAGLYLEYGHGLSGGSDVLEAKLLLAKRVGRFEGMMNLILERPLGVPAGQGYGSYGYAASATWRTVGKLRLGVEAFGDLGDDHAFLGRQGAYIGPEIKWEARPPHSPVEFELDAGWLAAVGPDRNEAQSQARVAIELERRF
jgi:hypothetical protein